jgi:hypothetical protein
MQTRTVFELRGAQLHAPIEQLLGNSEVKLLQHKVDSEQHRKPSERR